MHSILDLSEEEVKEAWRWFKKLVNIDEFYDIMTALRGPDVKGGYSLKATFTENIRKVAMKQYRHREWPEISVHRAWIEDLLTTDLQRLNHVLEHVLCALESMKVIVREAEVELYDYVKWLYLLAEAINRLKRIDNRIRLAQVLLVEEHIKEELENMDNTMEDVRRLIEEGYTRSWLYWPEEE